MSVVSLRWRGRYISFANGLGDYPLYQISGASGGRRAFWRIPEALLGRHAVSYDLERVLQALEKGAEQYKLDPPAIIGDCLRQQCLRYFQAAGFVGLESLCKLIDYPLPEPPDCTTIDRSYGQLHLLQAMAQGIRGVSQEVSILRERDDDMGDDLYDGLF